MISIDDRMKDFYERRNRRFLTRRTPVIIRIDGKAFHTYTKGLKKPFDEGLIEDMQRTMLYLCKNIQGCKFGYVQSDEISLLLTDYDTLTTDAWFDYCQNKMESIAASMATGIFNQLRFQRYLEEGISEHFNEGVDLEDIRIDLVDICNYMPLTGSPYSNIANFDARAFNVPKDDVTNYFVWRQNDATKNSISMLAQSLYPHKELQGKNGDQMQEMCFQKGINWNNIPTSQKRGSACYKVRTKKDLSTKISFESLRGGENTWFESIGEVDSIQQIRKWGVYVDDWTIDNEIPIFTSEVGRTLINILV